MYFKIILLRIIDNINTDVLLIFNALHITFMLILTLNIDKITIQTFLSRK